MGCGNDCFHIQFSVIGRRYFFDTLLNRQFLWLKRYIIHHETRQNQYIEYTNTHQHTENHQTALFVRHALLLLFYNFITRKHIVVASYNGDVNITFIIAAVFVIFQERHTKRVFEINKDHNILLINPFFHAFGNH